MGVVDFELEGKSVNFKDLKRATDETLKTTNDEGNNMAEKVDTLEQEVEQLRVMLQSTAPPAQKQNPKVFGIVGQDYHLTPMAWQLGTCSCGHRPCPAHHRVGSLVVAPEGLRPLHQ